MMTTELMMTTKRQFSVLALIFISTLARADICFDGDDEHYIRLFPIGKTQVRFDYCTFNHFHCEPIGSRPAYPDSLFAKPIPESLHNLAEFKRMYDTMKYWGMASLALSAGAGAAGMSLVSQSLRISGITGLTYPGITHFLESSLGVSHPDNLSALIDLYDQATQIGASKDPAQCSWNKGNPETVRYLLKNQLAKFDAHEMSNAQELEFATQEGRKAVVESNDRLSTPKEAAQASSAR